MIHPPLLCYSEGMKTNLALLIFFFAIALLTTRFGLRFNPDTPLFLDGARALQTEGLLSESEALNHWPPLQSFLILLSGHNLDMMRLVYALVMTGNIAVFAYGLRYLTQRRTFTLLLILAVGLTPYLVYAHTFLLSDTPFVLMVNVALLLLYRERYGYAAGVVALACLQRYAGIALIGVGVLWMLQHANWRKALQFGIISTLPIGLWLLRGAVLLDRAGRHIGWHPITAEKMTGLSTILNWFLPILLVCGVFWIINRNLPPLPQLPKLSLFFAGSYLLFLFVSISLFDPATALYGRILLPMLIPLWWVFAWFIEQQLEHLRPVFRTPAYSLLVVMLLMSILAGIGNAVALAATIP